MISNKEKHKMLALFFIANAYIGGLDFYILPEKTG